MKKNIIYLFILLLSIFGGINSVEADEGEMLCKYHRAAKLFSKETVVYMYSDGKGNFKVTTMKIDGSKYVITKGNINKIKYDNGVSKCPSYLDGDGSGNYKAGTGTAGKNYNLVEGSEIYAANKQAWNKKVYYDDDIYGILDVTLSYNDFGFFSYKGVNKIVIHNYSDGVSPTFLCTSALKSEGYATFDDDGCAAGAKLSLTILDSEDDSSSGNDTENGADDSSDENDKSDVVLPEEDDVLGVGRYCLYRNEGHCSGDDGDKNGDCGGFSSEAKKESYFVRAPYAIIRYDTSTLKPMGVYLPKYKEVNGAFVVDQDKFGGFSSAYSVFDGSRSHINSMVVNYFDYYDTAQISILESADISEEVKDGCPTWFVETSGADGSDYEDNMYFYQYYNTDPEDNDNTEDPGVADEGVEVEALDGPYYCVYDVNSKEVALKYNTEKTKLYLLSQDYNNLYHSYLCEFDDCSSVGGISFSGYGGNESNHNRSFQNDIVAGTCPKQINYSNGILTLCKNASSDCDKDVGKFGEFLRFSNTWEGDTTEVTPQGIDDCGELFSDDLTNTLNKYMNIFRILVPIILLVLGVVDFVGAIFSSNEDGMKKAQSKFVKRVIVAVVIFLVPTFVNLLMDIADLIWGWNAGSCDVK